MAQIATSSISYYKIGWACFLVQLVQLVQLLSAFGILMCASRRLAQLYDDRTHTTFLCVFIIMTHPHDSSS